MLEGGLGGGCLVPGGHCTGDLAPLHLQSHQPGLLPAAGTFLSPPQEQHPLQDPLTQPLLQLESGATKGWCSSGQTLVFGCKSRPKCLN